MPIGAAQLHLGNEFRLAGLCGVLADAANTRLKILRRERLEGKKKEKRSG
jgi:hypothetical protein